MHKLRAVMGNRDSQYLLDGLVEMDDAFFTSNSEDKEDKDENSKPKCGRRTSKSKVLVMTKVVAIKGRPKKHRKSSDLRYVKMIHVEGLDSETINDKVIDSIFLEATVKTDAYKGFYKLFKVIAKHKSQVVPGKEASKALPWVHTMKSNAKRSLLGLNHSVKTSCLQNYLNVFCYKTNRRYFKDKLFDRLLVAAVAAPWYDDSE